MKSIQPTSRLGRFVKTNYGTIVNFGREINKYFKTKVFLDSNNQCELICAWARGENKPRQAKWKWDLMVKYCKKVHNVDVDLTWLEQDQPQPEPKAEPVTEQPQLNFDEPENTAFSEQSQITEDDFRESFYDIPASERVYQTKEAATALIRRAYNIYELSKADVGFSSNCCRLSDGYWPSVTIFHDSLGKCGSKVIDLNGEADLQRVADLLGKLEGTDREETDAEFLDRMFEGCNPADFDRIVSIIKKGGCDE